MINIVPQSLLGTLLREIAPEISDALDSVLSGNDLSYFQILDLLNVSHKDLIAVLMAGCIF